jgi:hypothetical protein
MRQDIIQSLATLRMLPNAQIDRNFFQGREAVKEQVEQYIVEREGLMHEIKCWVQPYILPEDYIFFLGYCGGLYINTSGAGFMLDGLGPMVEEWYGYLKGEYLTEPSIEGLLHIGCLAFHNPINDWYPRVEFFIKLQEGIDTSNIIGIEKISRTHADKKRYCA